MKIRYRAAVAVGTLLTSLAFSLTAGAQDSAATVHAEEAAKLAQRETDAKAKLAKERQRLADIEKNSQTFRFGLSLGWRHNMADGASLFRDVAINPADGSVAVDTLDRGAFVLSGVITAFPWRNNVLTKEKSDCDCGPGLLWHLGFIATSTWRSSTPTTLRASTGRLKAALALPGNSTRNSPWQRPSSECSADAHGHSSSRAQC